MARTIGFTSFDREWEGPAEFEFRYFREHTRTARYRCRLEERFFDLYAPLVMLSEVAPDSPPERLLVAIGRAPETLRSIGFEGERLPPR